MCGICGIYNHNSSGLIDIDQVARMASVMNHRGPDEEGYYQNTSRTIALGHKRLNIIDLDTGKQPISNEDERLWVVFNGEIYNFAKLREDLMRSGHCFRTQTDTEVIVHLYEAYGEQCLEYLRGMFAFAIWDNKTKSLFLARDRVGKKPLYYCEYGGQFVFASEIKAILEVAHIPHEVNYNAIQQYLTFGYIPAPQTIFDNIKKLLPGHCMRIANEVSDPKRYWSIDFTKKIDISESECERTIFELLTDATKVRMRSDVPWGAFLSGGLDSSMIVALMARESSMPIKTFSIGFDDDQFNELSYARYLAAQYHTDHHEYVVRPDIISIIDDLVWFYDQPFADSSSIPTFYLAKMTRQKVTVALSGDGGDENFAGYPRHRAIQLFNTLVHAAYFPHKVTAQLCRNILSAFPEGIHSKNPLIKAKKFIASLAHAEKPLGDNYLSWFCHSQPEETTRVLSDSCVKLTANQIMQKVNKYFDDQNVVNVLDQTLNADIETYLPDDLLVKADYASMAHSLEVRSPFLDHAFMEFAAKIPPQFKMRQRIQKYILKKVARDIVPPSIVRRKKMGFGIPIGEWFHTDLQTFCKHILVSDKVKKRGILNPVYVTNLVNEHMSGKYHHGYKLWNVLMLELWFRKYIDKQKSLV